MARKKVPEQDLFPYHITGRCNNKNSFPIPLDKTWPIFQEQLFFLGRAFNFKIHSFVLMPNHYHMLATTPDCNLSKGMRWFMKETARYINYEAGRINQLWGGRFFRSQITTPLYYLHAYKYVYCNPLKAKLTNSVENYPFSSLNGLLQDAHILFTVDDTTLWDMGTESSLKWLNKVPSDENWHTVRCGLEKSTFKLKKCPGSKKLHPLELQLL